jgi:arylamine N-acetyltransferase
MDYAPANPMEGFPAPLLSALRELSVLPYENLSKIVAFSQGGNMENTLGLAADWLEKSRDTGAGGTCFSLTWWLERRLRESGLDCAFLMGDKGNAKDVHCGLRCDWQGRSYLLDPGYMIFDPLPLPEAGLSAEAWVPPNAVRVEDLPSRDAWRLWSGPRGELKFRFDFRKRAVTQEEFLAHWRASYRLPMMDYPVLNRISGGVQYYLQKRSLLVRTEQGGEMRKLSKPEMLEVLGVTFGIPEPLAREALVVVVAKTPDFFSR